MDRNELLIESSHYFVNCQIVSNPLLQLKFNIDYKTAQSIIVQLCELGVLIQKESDFKLNIFTIAELEILLKNKGYSNTNFNTSKFTFLKIKFPLLFPFLKFILIPIVSIAVYLYFEKNWIKMNLSYDEKESIEYFIILSLTTYILWSIRNTPLGFLWKWYKLFWLVLFAILLLNYAKKQFKEWWKKD